MPLKNNAEPLHILTSRFKFALILGKQIYATPVFRIQQWDRLKISSGFNAYVEHSKEQRVRNSSLLGRTRLPAEQAEMSSQGSPVEIMRQMRSKVCVSVAFHQSSALAPLQAAASLPEGCDPPSGQ